MLRNWREDLTSFSSSQCSRVYFFWIPIVNGGHVVISIFVSSLYSRYTFNAGPQPCSPSISSMSSRSVTPAGDCSLQYFPQKSGEIMARVRRTTRS